MSIAPLFNYTPTKYNKNYIFVCDQCDSLNVKEVPSITTNTHTNDNAKPLAHTPIYVCTVVYLYYKC